MEVEELLDEIVVGFKDEAEKIIHRLQQDRSSDLDIVSIIGMPGSGKTVLAKMVYNHTSVKSEFYVRAWCCVSQNYQKRQVLLDLLRDLTMGEENPSHHGFDELNDDELGEVLFKSLYEKRYLVVLDDIWNIEAWNDLKNCFPNNKNGSRILFTSRMKSVALEAQPNNEPHALRLLTDSESFELLQRKLFQKQDCPTEIQDVMREIARNCKGLPLSVQLCSNILATMEKERWKDVVESLSSTTFLSSSRILELSYKSLSDHLKPCLLYFGSFLPDQEILVSRLVWRWIAEGFVQHMPNNGDEGKRLEDLAMEYLMDLIDRNLVIVAKKGLRGGIKEIRVHNLVHGFCVMRAKEENFLQVQNLEEQLDRSLEPNRLCIYSWENLLPHSVPNLSSLIYFGNGNGRLSLLSEFSNIKLLKVLDFRGFTVASFPSEVENLVQLRYLALSGHITSLPSTIVKLENLETFLLKGLLAEISLPFHLLQLRKLKRLLVNNHVVFSVPEKNLDQECPESSNMETLSTLLLSSRQEFLKDMIKKMPYIRKLKCTYLRSKYSGEGYQIPALDFLSQLESLNVHSLSKVGYDLVFKFPSNLKKLTLSNFRLPWENFTKSISTLKNLEVLKLLNKACEGESWDLESEEEEFPNLKFLKLENLDIIRLNASSDNFPRLKELMLKGCEKLEDISNDMAKIYGLKTIQIIKCSDESVATWARYAEEIGVKVFFINGE